jgi:transposase
MELGETAVRQWVAHADEMAQDDGIGKPLTVEQQRIRQPETEKKSARRRQSMR